MKKIGLLVAVLLALPFAAEATFTQQAALANDGVFQGQITVAMLQTAANIPLEAVTTQGHAERALFAAQVIQHPAVWAPIVSQLIASQTNNAMTPLTVPSTVADSLIATAVSAQWTNMSGYVSH